MQKMCHTNRIDHRYGLGVTWQRARVRSPVDQFPGSDVIWGFPSTVRQSQEIWATFFPGYHMVIVIIQTISSVYR